MIDTTLSTFDRDVIEASLDVPVLVDFWAPWCGPCRSLGPMLERLEREYGGRFRLVNVNSDTNPELVESFNLKSVPYAVVSSTATRSRSSWARSPSPSCARSWIASSPIPRSSSIAARAKPW